MSHWKYIIKEDVPEYIAVYVNVSFQIRLQLISYGLAAFLLFDAAVPFHACCNTIRWFFSDCPFD